MDDKGRSLSRKEFEDVMRRAAELAASDPEGGEAHLEETEVLRIAAEVGLPERHVRRALSEMRSGGAAAGGPLDRIFGSEFVRASRVVPGTPKQIARKLDDFMVAGQLLESVRRSPSLLQYRPAVDWMSQVARAASSMSKRYYVASAKNVEVRLESLDDDETLVEFQVDAGIRGEFVTGGLLGGGAAGGGAGFGTGALILNVAGLPMLVAGPAAVVVGGAVAAGVLWASGRGHRKRLLEVHTEVEGILDRLEMNEPLQPPPASWRRWVKRHFHGAVSDILGPDDDELGDGLDEDLDDGSADRGFDSDRVF